MYIEREKEREETNRLEYIHICKYICIFKHTYIYMHTVCVYRHVCKLNTHNSDTNIFIQKLK